MALTTDFLYCMFPQCVPYLIAIGTDEEQQMRVKSDQQLSEIDSKYSMFVQVGTSQPCFHDLIFAPSISSLAPGGWKDERLRLRTRLSNSLEHFDLNSKAVRSFPEFSHASF